MIRSTFVRAGTLYRSLLAAGMCVAFGLATTASALDLETATIADLDKALDDGSLTSVKLERIYLARLQAYDKQGPMINTMIYVNANALADAKRLDTERKAGKVRGPLHGIPIVLKDNFDTVDMPTTAGSQMLAGSMPPDDAFLVKKLRDAGAIFLGKVNLHEFAAGGGVGGAVDSATLRAGAVPNGFSSMGGQTRNPHELMHGPAGSSTGTAAAIAAVFAQFGMGSDTTSSVRGPASANGVVGFKPTNGLLSRDGIVPLALTLDTAGPITRSVYDAAVAMNVLVGIDKADPLTLKSEGHIEKDYRSFLKAGALKGVRIGIARDFNGQNAEVDRVFDTAISTLNKLGAVTMDIHYPTSMLEARNDIANIICAAEFKAQIADYLKTTGPKYPKTLDDLARIANDPGFGYRSPEKAYGLKYTQAHALEVDDPIYLAARNEGVAMVKAAVDATLAKDKLDVIVYVSSPNAAPMIEPAKAPRPASGTGSAYNIANITGYPDLVVPAGMTNDGLPVTISFMSTAFEDGKVLGYGYDFEQATRALRLPKNTPALASDKLK